jgi:hypothetical protein
MKITEGNAKLSKILIGSFFSSPKIIKVSESIENNKYSLTYKHTQEQEGLYPKGWDTNSITLENIEVHCCGKMSKKKRLALKTKWDKVLNSL